jgi:RHS repeat-associated protein
VQTVRNGVRQVVYFDYDALGRRIRKRDAFGETLFLWDGLQMIQEQRGGNVATYLYEPGTYVPVARVDLNTVFAKTFDVPNLFNSESAISNKKSSVLYFSPCVSGASEELSGDTSHLDWSARYHVWGNAVIEQPLKYAVDPNSSISTAIEQNLRYQGQYLDSETGLHYNTFRFYDPDIGKFITPDPIGLKGGINLYKYGPNPLIWIDPLGWASNNPGVYDVHFEAKLPTRDMYRLGDNDHFREGNRQLYYAMKNDPHFATEIEIKYPGISKWVAPTNKGTFRGRAFSGTTWHHHGQVGGLLQLVDTNDHRSRHLDYHPKGVGGRNKWGGGTKCR